MTFRVIHLLDSNQFLPHTTRGFSEIYCFKGKISEDPRKRDNHMALILRVEVDKPVCYDDKFGFEYSRSHRNDQGSVYMVQDGHALGGGRSSLMEGELVMASNSRFVIHQCKLVTW